MFINHLGWQHHQEQQKGHQSVMEPTQNTHSPHNNPQNPHQTSHFHHPWTHQFYPSTMFTAPSVGGFNLNHEDNNEEEVENVQNPETSSNQFPEKEAMFEKPLTPSDVGKLNRLVIPKQHAEKYFPLGGDSGDKGLLLSFEDEAGKPWRFRYSYWNSSQSYVLTKGWSRYVKEKRLDAGDVILFERHRTDGERFFIGWRRRPSAGGGTTTQSQECSAAAAAAASGGGNDGWSRGFYETHPYLGHIQGGAATAPFPYQPDCLHAASVQSQTTAGNSKRQLRLFGVNLECELDESEPSTPDGSSISSQGPTYQQFYTHSHPYSDITFSQDMRNRRG